MNSVCLNCRRESQMKVELLCDHELCYDCAEKIKIPQGVPPLDAKFRICCPACKKNTTTLNIQNLINQGNDKFLFINIESSELSEEGLEQPHHDGTAKLSQSKLRKMSYTQRRNNVYAERKTPEVTQRNSKASHDSKRNTKSRQGESILQVKCHRHKETLMFYCEQEKAVLCMHCMYRHMKEQKNHQVCSISDAINAIASNNKLFKVESKKKIEEIDKCAAICKSNKTCIDQAFEIHHQLISQEFKELEKLIKLKEHETKSYLQKIFEAKQRELKDQLNNLNYLRSCLKEHYEYLTDSSSAHLYFFNAYTHMRSAINKVAMDTKLLKKEDLACFEKHASIQDFSFLLEKFFRPKTDGRESKAGKKESNAPSRGASQNGAKIKQQLIEQTKKRLQKLNKMENEHKQVKNKDRKEEEYLNNYFIEDIGLKQFESSGFCLDKPGNNVGNYRKSSASELTDKKVPHKTLTPTRTGAVTASSKMKKK